MMTALPAIEIAIETPHPGRLVVTADAEKTDAIARVVRAIAAADISAAIDYAAALGCAGCTALVTSRGNGVIGLDDIEDAHANGHANQTSPYCQICHKEWPCYCYQED